MYMESAKLDMYDYELIYNQDTVKRILINVKGNTDVTIADIATEITTHNDNIYVEGKRLIHKNSYMERRNNGQPIFVIDVIDVTPTIKTI